MPVRTKIADSLAAIVDHSGDQMGDTAGFDYPDLKDRFWALFTNLGTQSIATPQGEINADALFTLVDGRNNWKAQLQGLTGYIPKVVAELEASDATPLGQLPALRDDGTFPVGMVPPLSGTKDPGRPSRSG